MTELLDRKLEDLDALCREIAQIEHDNSMVIEIYRGVRESIDRLTAKLDRKYGGPIASEQVIRKKVDEFRKLLGPPPRTTRLGSHTARLGAGAKVEVIRVMLDHFASLKKDRVSLEDISEWFSEPRQRGYEDIRDKLMLRGTKVAQAQWFRVNFGGEVHNLYPDDAYESQQAPHKSYFNVTKWRTWLGRSQDKLARLFGEPNKKPHQATKKKR